MTGTERMRQIGSAIAEIARLGYPEATSTDSARASEAFCLFISDTCLSGPQRVTAQRNAVAGDCCSVTRSGSNAAALPKPVSALPADGRAPSGRS
jgi:hypothetical protein